MGPRHRRKSKPPRRQEAAEKHAIADRLPQDMVDADPRNSDLTEADPTEHRSEQNEQDDKQLNENDDHSNAAQADATEATGENTIHACPLEIFEPAIPITDAKQVLELFFSALLAASVSPLALLTQTRRALSFADLEQLLIDQIENVTETEQLQLQPQQRRALRRVCTELEGGAVDVHALIELAGAATFRIEMLEFQIRQAILDRSGSKSRGKVDVQRTVAKLTRTQTQHDATSIITSTHFAALLEEKLGVSCSSSLLVRVVFARVTGQPFTHRLPKLLQCATAQFTSALESFVTRKPLSLDSVEGQLRHLVATHADLHASFGALDVDGSGAISVDEVVAFLQKEAQMQYPRDVIAAFIQRFDVDGDGSLSVDEFVAFVSPRQFGVHVLTPFGKFYQAADRRERMKDVVAKIKTRMFWMQHNDLFATKSLSSSTHPVGQLKQPPLQLKVATDHFILTHHYGTLRLRYKDSDAIASVVKNGELLVLVLQPEMISMATTKADDVPLPVFEYRLKPNTKRCIPPLMSWIMARTDENELVATSLPLNFASETRAAPHCRIHAVVATGLRRPSRQQDVMDTSATGVAGSSTSTFSSPETDRIEHQSSARAATTRRTPSTHKNTAPFVTPKTRKDSTAANKDRRHHHHHQQRSTVPVSVPEVSSLADSKQKQLYSPSDASATEYEYFEPGTSAASSSCGEDDDGVEFGEFGSSSPSLGDECGPPQVHVGDATVESDEDEPPPPPYDG